jgi:hypothetical protein
MSILGSVERGGAAYCKSHCIGQEDIAPELEMGRYRLPTGMQSLVGGQSPG